ncbi:SRPBCC family protein [Rubrivirga sp. IMCC43871]|uniref:SRPBCC family protein n=1 Tax=Rubrivirga sp. IMCC43871 TaxID=3391575 RepID=UPI0039901CB9
MTVENTLHIDASPDVVWAVTEDVDRWPEWTPTISSVRRLDDLPLGIGSKALVKQPGQAEAEWTVTDFVAGERFCWQTERTGLVVEATHELRPEGAGTLNVLRVVASGVLAPLLSPVLRPLVLRALVRENLGLRARCEGEPAAAPRS